MNQNIVDKYNIPVPRYTSYPPANYFSSDFGGEEYQKSIIESNSWNPSHISFYIHIPFCNHLCHYCGCNSFAMTTREGIERYIAALHSEIDRVVPLIDKSRKISQIHYGGGSPTAIPVKYLKEINRHLSEKFDFIENPEIAVECHPGYLRERDWSALVDAGFNRFSLGIQDFDKAVLKGVNRRPSLLEVEDIFTILRGADAKINLDFIYGLPLQTVDSFCNSIERAVKLSPDRLVMFSYAHVPWVNSHQRLLEVIGLPSTTLKSDIFNSACSIVSDAGYKTIGMDHFVTENDELYHAKQNFQLHRNFQGYSTRRTTGQVYAFGSSAISQLGGAYAQNEKTPERYVEMIEKGGYATIKGYQLTNKQQITREVIEALMCNYKIEWKELSNMINVSVEELKTSTSYSEDRMKEFEGDGLINFNNEEITITKEGMLFVRNVAASLDRLMIDNKLSFSKPI